MVDRQIVRFEIEYDDGEVRRATGDDADQILWFYRTAAEFYLVAQKRSYDGPTMAMVQEARPDHPGDTPDDARVRRTLSELARGELG